MDILFYSAAAVAILATLAAITRLDPVHALLYLIVSFLAVAVMLYTLGAPFVAALEAIVYAGAIMVLFVFVVMMLNLGARTREQERHWLAPGMWIGPGLLAGALLGELGWFLTVGSGAAPAAGAVAGPKAVGMALFGPYVIGVELASMLLLAGLVGAFHLGRHEAVALAPEEERS